MTTIGPDARFRLTGFGRDRMAELVVSGPTIATTRAYAMSRDGYEVRAMTGRMPTIIHSRRFERTAAPTKPIEGSSEIGTRAARCWVDAPRRSLRGTDARTDSGHHGDDRHPG